MSQTKPIGTITVLADSVDVYEYFEFNPKFVKKLHKGETYKVYRKDGRMYGLGGGREWVTIEEDKVHFKKA